MSSKVTKCAKCRQELLQRNPSKCPYCGAEEFVSEEETREPAEVKTAKVASVTLLCPNCGQKQSLNAKQAELKCPRCGEKYAVPDRVLELLS